jgi:5-methylcytosine-specific restriction endonuclease McrA
MKTCSKCGVIKPFDAYYPHAEGKFGYRPDCKECFSARRKARYERTRDKVLAAQKEYTRRNAAKVREMHRIANLRRRQDPEWAQRQRDYNRQYGVKNREGRLRRERERRARLQAAPVNDFTRKDWQLLKQAYQNRCAYCGQTVGKLQKDHVIPLIRGGAHTIRNIVPACGPCNLRKGLRAEMPFQVIPSWFVA